MNLTEWSALSEASQHELIIQFYKEGRWGESMSHLAFENRPIARKQLAKICWGIGVFLAVLIAGHSASTSQTYFKSSLEAWLKDRNDGFDDGRGILLTNQYQLAFCNVSNVLTEVQATNTMHLIQELLKQDGPGTKLPDYRFGRIYNGFEELLWVSCNTKSAPEDVRQKFKGYVSLYVRNRLDGHSLEYTQASLRDSPILSRANVGNDDFRQIAKSFNVPVKWLKPWTNSYVVFDSGLAWVYPVPYVGLAVTK